MYGTAIYSRIAVIPGMLVKFQGKEWVASANTEKGLYLRDLSSHTRINDDWIEVCLDKHGIVAGKYYTGAMPFFNSIPAPKINTLTGII
ncbi:hypothetical protein [Pantoea agglomerans]|uniref:hypothetical protein n=1 Tax=Enterobacter agglomerans TaxID=549 RepID=UPI0024135F61|nr:hypothetical protein [Pantoea agglomerans]